MYIETKAGTGNLGKYFTSAEYTKNILTEQPHLTIEELGTHICVRRKCVGGKLPYCCLNIRVLMSKSLEEYKRLFIHTPKEK